MLAYRRIDQFRGDASVRTWMVSIAWRLALSRRRRLWWKGNRKAAPETELHALRDVTPSPEARMQSAQFIKAVQQQIRRLSAETARCAAAGGGRRFDAGRNCRRAEHSGVTFRGRVRDARLRLKARLGAGMMNERRARSRNRRGRGSDDGPRAEPCARPQVMARVREDAAPAPRSIVWIAAAAGFVLCAAIATARDESDACNQSFICRRRRNCAIAQAAVVPAVPIGRPHDDAASETCRHPNSGAKVESATASPPDDVSPIEPIETEPIALSMHRRATAGARNHFDRRHKHRATHDRAAGGVE